MYHLILAVAGTEKTKTGLSRRVREENFINSYLTIKNFNIAVNEEAEFGV